MFVVHDLTQPLNSGTLSFPGTDPAFRVESVDVGQPNILLSRLEAFDVHAGTHMDAPLHFVPSATDIAGVPLRVLPATVLSIVSGQIRADDVPADCAGRALLFSTGWERKAGSREYFTGHPSISLEAAWRLVDADVALVGFDTPSCDDVRKTPDCPAHHVLCEAGVPIVEGLVHLEPLIGQAGPIYFVAFPLPFAGVEASPVRAVALLPA